MDNMFTYAYKKNKNNMDTEQKVPSGHLTHIKFSILSGADIERSSVMSIDTVSDLSNPKLGLPNLSFECSTCGGWDSRSCDGHPGRINFHRDIVHPHFISETVKILNKICPGCKHLKEDFGIRGSATMAKQSTSPNCQSTGCKYCAGSSIKWYPKMKFKVASRNSFGNIGSAVVVVEVIEKMPRRFQGKHLSDVLPTDYWNFIKEDPHQEDGCLKSDMRTLSSAQVYCLLKDVDPNIIEKLFPRRQTLFLTCFPVTPNCNRITETFDRGTQLINDDRSKAYKRLIGFKGVADELSLHVHDCINTSKLVTKKSSNMDNKSGLKWLKEVVLGKRTDSAFRMVVVGDPNIKLGEIGLPQDICQKLQNSEILNERNLEEINASLSLQLLQCGQFHVTREGELVGATSVNGIQMGDITRRPLDNGDPVIVNRPPSVHQHSILGFSVRVLPTDFVVSINPICISPFDGDFDGDCLHGYIPQSVMSKAEVKELVSIKQQLINGQSGRNLLSLSQDCITAAYLVREKDVYLDRVNMMQLAMTCPHQLPDPAILKAGKNQNPVWTGKQLFSMLLPRSFDYVSPSKGVQISKGEILSTSLESSWLQDTDDNIYCSLIRHSGSEFLDILFATQEVLLEWISMRGLSVSLSDIYLCPDSYSRSKLMEEVRCGLQESEEIFHSKVGVGLANHPNKKTVLSRIALATFREVFRDLQSLIYQYSGKDNSLLAMVKAGSKGNLLKLAQEGISLGLHHASAPLSFKIPFGASCAIWNHEKMLGFGIPESFQSEIPYAVIPSCFLSGLNPVECFYHSLSCRNSSFSDNADVPGSLTRKLMFYMRDLSLAYDGTVRNTYGNQIVQFSYDDASAEVSSVDDDANGLFDEKSRGFDGFGNPVGSLAACSISEAAYSASKQPISTLESSPLLSLKKLLESTETKMNADRTISLFLSKKLGKWLYGYEYGALKVKSHLERVLFDDVVCNVMIFFTLQSSPGMRMSPWISHFHVCKERMRRRGLNVQSIIEALSKECKLITGKPKSSLPKLQILSRRCSEGKDDKEDEETICITVAAEISEVCSIRLDAVREVLIPFLLGTVIKGFAEFKKVEILWNNLSHASLSSDSPGELFMKVYISENSKTGCWNLLLDRCIRIMHLVDWERSHPDSIHDLYRAYGIGAARRCFLKNLKDAVSSIGKTILLKHLDLAADTLSVTGEFVGLTEKGIAQIRNLASVSSPFMQACFAKPAACFTKAAKKGAGDDLLGTLDAIAWGKEVPIGTGGKFDIIYSGKGHELAKPLDICGVLSNHLSSKVKNVKSSVQSSGKNMYDRWCVNSTHPSEGLVQGRRKHSDWKLSSVGKSDSLGKVLKMGVALQAILHKYRIDQCLNETDRSLVVEAIRFHPRSSEKIGIGLQDIKVGKHDFYKNTRCFFIVRTDGTTTDFSYRKCVDGAARTQLPAHFVNKMQKALFSTTNVDLVDSQL